MSGTNPDRKAEPCIALAPRLLEVAEAEVRRLEFALADMQAKTSEGALAKLMVVVEQYTDNGPTVGMYLPLSAMRDAIRMGC